MSLFAGTQELTEYEVRAQIRARVQQCDTLPTIPGVKERLLALVDDVNVSIDTLEALIKTDLTFVASLLQLANSAFYNHNKAVVSVRRAILLLGFNTLKKIALHLPVFADFSPQDPIVTATLRGIWHHGLLVATLAAYIAPHTRQQVEADLAFCAGLLHNIGQVALLHLFAPTYQDLLVQAQQQPAYDLSKMELTTLHVTHTEVGYWLGKAWHFPPPLLDVIAQHHFTRITDPPTAVVVLADCLVKTCNIGLPGSNALRHDPTELLRLLGLPARRLDEYLAYLERTLAHLSPQLCKSHDDQSA